MANVPGRGETVERGRWERFIYKVILRFESLLPMFLTFTLLTQAGALKSSQVTRITVLEATFSNLEQRTARFRDSKQGVDQIIRRRDLQVIYSFRSRFFPSSTNSNESFVLPNIKDDSSNFD